jgi:hypothetical protein
MRTSGDGVRLRTVADLERGCRRHARNCPPPAELGRASS